MNLPIMRTLTLLGPGSPLSLRFYQTKRLLRWSVKEGNKDDRARLPSTATEPVLCIIETYPILWLNRIVNMIRSDLQRHHQSRDSLTLELFKSIQYLLMHTYTFIDMWTIEMDLKGEYGMCLLQWRELDQMDTCQILYINNSSHLDTHHCPVQDGFRIPVVWNRILLRSLGHSIVLAVWPSQTRG